MVVKPGSWADFGYRKLGPLPAAGGGLSPAQVAERLTREGDYEATPDHWVRRRARRKGVGFRGSIEVVAVLDRETPLDDNHLAFIDLHARSPWTRFAAELPQFRADFSTLVGVVERAEDAEERCRGLYRLSQALFHVDPGLLRPMFRRHVAPCFFRLYPEGKVVVLRYDTAVDDAAAGLRILYAMAQAPLPELVKEGFQGVRTLRTWHMTSLVTCDPTAHRFFPSDSASFRFRRFSRLRIAAFCVGPYRFSRSSRDPSATPPSIRRGTARRRGQTTRQIAN